MKQCVLTLCSGLNCCADDPSYNKLYMTSSNFLKFLFSSTLLNIYCCCCSVAKSCPVLCDPMDCSTPGFPVLHYLPELAQTHVHWVSDVIQVSCPLSLLRFMSMNKSMSKHLLLCIRLWQKLQESRICHLKIRCIDVCIIFSCRHWKTRKSSPTFALNPSCLPRNGSMQRNLVVFKPFPKSITNQRRWTVVTGEESRC